MTIARGSSDHAAAYLAYLLTVRSGRLVTSLPMSLVTLYHAPLMAERLLAIAISQSGRSPDVVEPIRELRKGGATTVAILNERLGPLGGSDRVGAPPSCRLRTQRGGDKEFRLQPGRWRPADRPLVRL